MRTRPRLQVTCLPLFLAVALLCVQSAGGQQAAEQDPCTIVINDGIEAVVGLQVQFSGSTEAERNVEVVGEIENRLTGAEMLVPCVAAAEEQAKLTALLENRRMDKQVGASSAAGGSTTLVSSGSVPGLFGLAVEHGAMTRAIDGTTVTFRTNPAKLAAASKKLYGPNSIGPDNPKSSYQLKQLERFSVSVSFDTSRTANGTTETGTTFLANSDQLAEVTGRIELINHRDILSSPAARKIRQRRDTDEAKEFANQANEFLGAFQGMTAYHTLVAAKTESIYAANQNRELIESEYRDYIAQLRTIVAGVPDWERNIERMVTTWINFKAQKDSIYNQIAKSKILTLEYAFRRPPVLAAEAATPEIPPAIAPAATPTEPTVPAPRAPDVSTTSLIFAEGFFGGEFTATGSVSFFHEARPEMRGLWRDLQLGAKLDVPLGNLPQDVRGTLTFAGKYVHLHQRPLGFDLMINDETVNQRGNIGLFQAKYTIPIGDSGVKIPISLTVSNRTELIKESEIRGNIGLTFDLDKLLAKQ